MGGPECELMLLMSSSVVLWEDEIDEQTEADEEGKGNSIESKTFKGKIWFRDLFNYFQINYNRIIELFQGKSNYF